MGRGTAILREEARGRVATRAKGKPAAGATARPAPARDSLGSAVIKALRRQAADKKFDLDPEKKVEEGESTETEGVRDF